MVTMLNKPWAIEPRYFNAIHKMKINGESLQGLTPLSLSKPNPRQSGAIAVVPVRGTITQRPDLFTMMFGGTSTDALGNTIDEIVADESIKALVLDIDSPGGSVSGVQELSQKIFEARKKVHVVAVANSLMASAAYWIGSSADRIVASPSAEVGSIGVLAVHQDFSGAFEKEGVNNTIIRFGENKAEGNPFEPLSDDAAQALQERVDEIGNQFVADIARNRGVSKSDVMKSFGQGRVFGSKNAAEIGMIDAVQTLDDTLQSLGVGNANVAKIAASGSSAALAKKELELISLI